MKWKIILATVLLSVVLVVALLMTKGDAGPPAAVSFRGYEDDGQSAIFQITNTTRSPLLYACWATWSLRAGQTSRAILLGDEVHGVGAHQEMQLHIPMRILENFPDVRPTSVRVVAWHREAPTLARVKDLLRSVGVSVKAKRFEKTFDLTKPGEESPKQ